MTFTRHKRSLILSLIFSIILIACSDTPITPIQLTAAPDATISPLPAPTLPATLTPLSSPKSSPTPSQGQTAATSWRIRFIMSGGFAGIIRVVELSDDGLLRATDERTGKQAEMRLSAADLGMIGAWVMSAQSIPSTPRLSDCRDCLRYEITIRRGNETLTAELIDLDLDQSDLSRLINKLADLQEAALSR